MAYILPGLPGYRVTARGPIEVRWPDPPDLQKPVILFRRFGFGTYKREVGPEGAFDIHEAAVALYGADRTTIYRLINGGHLRAVKREGKILIPRRAIERYLALVSRNRRGRKLGEAWGGG